MTTIHRTTQTTPARAKEPQTRAAPPKPAPLFKGRDELSKGRTRALRHAVGTGAQPELDVKALRAFRAASKLNASQAALRADAAAAPQAVQEAATRNMEGVQTSTQFARRLEEETDPAVRDEMVRQALNSEWAGQLFTDTTFDPPESINHGFDDLSVIAGAVDHAVRSGAVTQTDFDTAVSHMSPEQTEQMVGALSIEGNNRALGGAVELLGVAARAEGHDRAAALAFTSTDSLIDKYYPTDAAQAEAFEQVESFVEEWDDSLQSDEHDPHVQHNTLQFALGSAARLSARGNGYSEQELQDELKELGPRFAQETIARLGEASRFDGRVPGAIDALSDAAQALADAGGDKADEFEVAAAIGYTQSTQLINQNLDEDGRKRALEVLNTFLADRRDAFRDAATADDPYSLLRDPQAIEGVNALLTADPTLLPGLLNGGPEGEATLVQLMESITFNPAVPGPLREAFQSRIDGFADDLASELFDDSNQSGQQLGRLFGLLQVAGSRSVEAAGERSPETQQAARDFANDILSGIAGAVLAPAGPVASIVGGAVLNQVLGSWLGTPSGPSETQLRNAFREWMAQSSPPINPASGEEAVHAFNTFLGQLIDRLDDVSPKPAGLDDRLDDLRDARTNIVDSFVLATTSNEEAGRNLRGELEERDDEP